MINFSSPPENIFVSLYCGNSSAVVSFVTTVSRHLLTYFNPLFTSVRCLATACVVSVCMRGVSGGGPEEPQSFFFSSKVSEAPG